MLPEGWEERKLESISSLITKGSTPTSYGHEYKKSGINFLRVENITEQGFISHDSIKFIDDKTHNFLARSQLRDGDLLISIAGALGRCAVVDGSDIPANVNQAIAIVRLKNRYSNKYVWYSIHSPRVQSRIKFLQSGLAQNNLNLQQVGSLDILLPPQEEQERIVHILSSIDTLITQLISLLSLKKKRKEALTQSLLTGKHRFPEFKTGKWRNVPLGDITIERTARNSAMNLHDVRAVNKTHGMIPMKEETIGKSLERYKIVEANDFAYNPMRINIGSICRWEEKEKCLVSPDYVVFRTIRELLDSDYLSHFRKSHRWNTYMERAGAGGVRIRIYYTDLANMTIPLPPTLEEQKRISAVLNAADQEIALLTQKLAVYQEQKKGLMQQLLTGKKRVKVGNQEAA